MLNSRNTELAAWDTETAKNFLGWFGSDDSEARTQIALRIEKAIAKLTSLAAGDFIKDRKSKDYAYVNPATIERGKYEHTVHLGSAFWATDDKTRAGTLIHEVSHFESVAGTDDVGSEERDVKAVDFAGKSDSRYDGSHAMYGGLRATRLAISSPKMALHNADSFEFFIEKRQPSIMQDEFGNPDFEGIGDFPGAKKGRKGA
jgi:peptidyl-Lys metalloendopeptidase